MSDKISIRKLLIVLLSFTLVFTMFFSTGDVYGAAKTSFKDIRPAVKEIAMYSDDCLRISWNKVNGASGYQVYKSATKSGTYSRISTTSGLYKKDYSVKSGKLYYYKVRAYKKVGGKNVYSKFSEIKSKRCTTYCRGISQIKMDKNNVVSLTAAKCKNAKGYYIYYAGQKDGPYKLIKTTTSKTTKVTFELPEVLPEYYFKVKAYIVVNGKKYFGDITKQPAVCVYSYDHYRDRYCQEMLQLVNDFRAENGIRPLVYSEETQPAADIRAQESYLRPDLSHKRYDKYGNLTNCFSIFSDLGLSWGRAAGENLAWNGFYSNPEEAARQTFNQWKNSPGHRANMLNSSFNQMATSVTGDLYEDGSGTYPLAAVQLFMGK